MDTSPDFEAVQGPGGLQLDGGAVFHLDEPEGGVLHGEYLRGVQDVEQRVFYDAVVNGRPLTVEPEQALVVTQILEAVYESARTGESSTVNTSGSQSPQALPVSF